MKTLIAALILLFASTARATPVTIEELLSQDPQRPTGTVTIIESQDCCSEKKGVPWWPVLFAGAAIPFAFIGNERPPEIIVPPITSPTPNATPQAVPESSTFALALIGLVGLFFLRGDARLPKVRGFTLLRWSSVAILILLTAFVSAAQTKTGKVTIRSNTPVAVRITDPGLVPIYSSSGPVSTLTQELRPGLYAVSFTLPDGTVRDRVVSIKKNCTTSLDLTYYPPSCPRCEQTPKVIPTPTPEPTPEFEFKPEPVPTLFDKCCACKRDDLKARLDLFAIELHRNPTVHGRIISSSSESVLYLVNQRGVDRSRLELQSSISDCVELWIVP